MYYALTLKDNIITGVHESGKPITEKTFAGNHRLSDNAVVVLESPVEYQTGRDIRIYNADGTQKPLIWQG